MGSLLPGSTLQEWGGKEVVLTTLVQWSTRSPHSHLPGVVEKKEIHTVWRGGGGGGDDCWIQQYCPGVWQWASAVCVSLSVVVWVGQW